MSPNDLIRRGDAMNAAHDCENTIEVLAALNNLPAVTAPQIATLQAEKARLVEALTVAALHLWFAANKMKGRCNGSDVSAVSMAEENARALLAELEKKA